MRLSSGGAVAKKASARVVPRASKYHSPLRLLGWRGEVQGRLRRSQARIRAD
jgi:hypothetical protein